MTHIRLALSQISQANRSILKLYRLKNLVFFHEPKVYQPRSIRTALVPRPATRPNSFLMEHWKLRYKIFPHQKISSKVFSLEFANPRIPLKTALGKPCNVLFQLKLSERNQYKIPKVNISVGIYLVLQRQG